MPRNPEQVAAAARVREASRLKVLIQIRGLTTLDSEEKVFLYNLATHKNYEEYSVRATVRQRLGLTDYKYRRARLSVIALNLVTAERISGSVTHYKLNLDRLSKLYDRTRDKTQLDPLAAFNKGGGRPQQQTHVDHRQIAHVDGQQQKENEKEQLEKLNKNNKKSALGKRTVRVPKRSAWQNYHFDDDIDSDQEDERDDFAGW